MNPITLWKFTEKARLAVNNLGEGYLVFTPACVRGVTPLRSNLCWWL